MALAVDGICGQVTFEQRFTAEIDDAKRRFLIEVHALNEQSSTQVLKDFAHASLDRARNVLSGQDEVLRTHDVETLVAGFSSKDASTIQLRSSDNPFTVGGPTGPPPAVLSSLAERCVGGGRLGH